MLMWKKFINLNFIFIMLWSICVSGHYEEGEEQNFINSFVNHYETSPEGRYTHEYHPFLLRYTANSLNELNSRLKSEGLNVAGRIIILGYEENAIPCYYSDFTRPKIDDEATLKKRSGWTTKLHNKFGFMTAFLFKDINVLSAQFFPEKDAVFDHVDFEHLDVDLIPIFDDRATIFQEHAFDGNLNLACEAYEAIIKKYMKHDNFGVLKTLTTFWKVLYKNALKVGTKQVSGTQDILFSIEHVRSLIKSGVPLSRFFIGPDLTYPIEISCKQEKAVTIHAQKFVKKMTSNLVSRNGKKTVYIFCSFVDGVGKSTMLGNIRNSMDFGDNVDLYRHVDNTSSQLADIFQYSNDVFIADLPAQISHFTYKPDGYVYTAVENELNGTEILYLRSYVKEHRTEFIAAYNTLVKKVLAIVQTDGYFAGEINDIKKPEYWFVKNLHLLKKLKDNRYIPFSHNGENYLFDSANNDAIKVLKKLEKVRSEGLKNVESEQMLFCFGIRMPLPYEMFLSDLVSRLKQNGIEEVVFVDFLSMYPRSSRENLRINYLLQQLALLNSKFNSQNSFYKDFVNGGGQLLSCLMNPHTHEQFKDALIDETLLRLGLFHMIQDYRHNDLTGLSIQEITQTMQKTFCDKTNFPFFNFLKNKVTDKLNIETDALEKIYGLSKLFVNIQQLSFKHICAFSNLIQDLFASNVGHMRLNKIWANCGKLIPDPDEMSFDSGPCNLMIKTNSDFAVHAIYRFDPECKSQTNLSSFLKILRQNWYAALSNILQSKPPKKNSSQKIIIEKEFIRVIPYLFGLASDGNFYLYQKTFPSFMRDNFKAEDFKNLRVFNQPKLPQQNKCVECCDVTYLAHFQAVPTNCGVFAFDCNLCNLKNNIYDGSRIGYFVQRYQLECDNTYVMPTSKLAEVLWGENGGENGDWQYCYECMVSDAKKNGEFTQNELLTEVKQQTNNGDKNSDQNQVEYGQYKNNIVGRAKKIYFGRKDQRPSVKLFIRLIATLEMVLKDPEADVVIRFGNRKDFAAAIRLFENSTIPNYFGLIFKEKLFKDYEKVEPYPSWAFWDSLDR